MNPNSEDRTTVNPMGTLMIQWYDFHLDGGAGSVPGTAETEGLKAGLLRRPSQERDLIMQSRKSFPIVDFCAMRTSFLS